MNAFVSVTQAVTIVKNFMKFVAREPKTHLNGKKSNFCNKNTEAVENHSAEHVNMTLTAEQ